MRYAIAASGLLGLSAAAPQIINISAALAVPTPTVLGPKVEETKPPAISYNPAAAAATVAAIVESEGVIEKRTITPEGEFKETVVPWGIIKTRVGVNSTLSKRLVSSGCGAPQPGGAFPNPGDGSVDAYLKTDSRLRQIARAAAAPSGYKESFVDQTGSSQQIGYLTYKSFDTYDVQGCADACDSEKYCLGFNIFFERDPKYDPVEGCANPDPITNVKCSLYGYPVALKAATNQGQWRGPQDANGEAFHVVITGSNGYSKTNRGFPSAPDFKAPVALPGSIQAPLDNGYDTYNGMRLFNNNPYDPTLCAAACEAQTEYDQAHPASDGSFKPCNFFTSYILTQNDVPLGTYCALYTRSWDPSYATNTGFWYGSDRYDVVSAVSYDLTSPVNGAAPKPVPAACTAPTGPPCGSTSITTRSGPTYTQTFSGCGLDNANDANANAWVEFNAGISLCDARNYCAGTAAGSSSDYAPNGFFGYTLYESNDGSLSCTIYVDGSDAAASAYTVADSNIKAAYGYSR